jgi:protein crumbs
MVWGTGPGTVWGIGPGIGWGMGLGTGSGTGSGKGRGMVGPGVGSGLGKGFGSGVGICGSGMEIATGLIMVSLIKLFDFFKLDDNPSIRHHPQ